MRQNKRFLLSLVGAITLFSNIFNGAFTPGWAIKTYAASPNARSSNIHIVGAEADSRDVNNILDIIADMVVSSNRHDMDNVLKHYSPRFVSGDNLNLKAVQHLIEETWKIYPDIHYDTKTLEIRINGDWATIESLDSSKAKLTQSAGSFNLPGTLESESRGMIYMRRVGKTWEILSDCTVYEKAVLLYGQAQKLNLSLSAPDQVFSGEPYSAKVNFHVPEGTYVISSINQAPLVFPEQQTGEKFRSLGDRDSSLERVFQANATNNNEIITANIGLAQLRFDKEERPLVDYSGMARLIKRVNVLPKSKYELSAAENQLVETSANGKVDLSKKPSPNASAKHPEEEESTIMIEKSPGDMDEEAP